jgi:hypothetical protein
MHVPIPGSILNFILLGMKVQNNDIMPATS